MLKHSKQHPVFKVNSNIEKQQAYNFAQITKSANNITHISQNSTHGKEKNYKLLFTDTNELLMRLRDKYRPLYKELT